MNDLLKQTYLKFLLKIFKYTLLSPVQLKKIKINFIAERINNIKLLFKRAGSEKYM